MAAPGEKHPEGQAVDVPGIGTVLRSVVLYGPNASGKSMLVEAFEVVRHLVLSGVRPDGSLPIAPHKLDPNWVKRPTTFELELCVEGVRYAYGIEATTREVVSEWLYRVEGEQSTAIFEREQGRIIVGDGLELEEKRREFYRLGRRCCRGPPMSGTATTISRPF